MKPINIEEIARRLECEFKQEKQTIKFHFVKAEVRCLDTEVGCEFAYTTDMHIKPYSKSIAEWDKKDWFVFVRDAISYYEENSRFSIDMVASVSLFTDDGCCFVFIV